MSQYQGKVGTLIRGEPELKGRKVYSPHKQASGYWLKLDGGMDAGIITSGAMSAACQLYGYLFEGQEYKIDECYQRTWDLIISRIVPVAGRSPPHVEVKPSTGIAPAPNGLSPLNTYRHTWYFKPGQASLQLCTFKGQPKPELAQLKLDTASVDLLKGLHLNPSRWLCVECDYVQNHKQQNEHIIFNVVVIPNGTSRQFEQIKRSYAPPKGQPSSSSSKFVS